MKIRERKAMFKLKGSVGPRANECILPMSTLKMNI